ncbi:MAG: hypothetical protein ACFFC7_24410 [Candidatus Hermodarchaeota archaeon]
MEGFKKEIGVCNMSKKENFPLVSGAVTVIDFIVEEKNFGFDIALSAELRGDAFANQPLINFRKHNHRVECYFRQLQLDCRNVKGKKDQKQAIGGLAKRNYCFSMESV